ncbi:hypothetical protein [Brevundimonas sp.]
MTETTDTPSVTAEGLSLDDLERLAKSATPGPWVSLGDRVISDETHDTIAGTGLRANGARTLAAGDAPTTAEEARNAAYIAALNPATALRLISEVRAAREALKPFAEAAATLSSRWEDHEDHWQESLHRRLTVAHLRAARTATEVKP